MDTALAIASLVIAVPALAAAIWSARESWQLRQIENERDRKQDLLEKQAQARTIATWLCVHDGAGDEKRWFLALANESPVPVYDAVATIAARYETPDLAIALVPPGRTYFELTRQEWRFGRQAEELGFAPRPLTQSTSFGVASLSFTDAGGHRWMRDDKGRIASIEGPSTS